MHMHRQSLHRMDWPQNKADGAEFLCRQRRFLLREGQFFLTCRLEKWATRQSVSGTDRGFFQASFLESADQRNYDVKVASPNSLTGYRLSSRSRNGHESRDKTRMNFLQVATETDSMSSQAIVSALSPHLGIVCYRLRISIQGVVATITSSRTRRRKRL